MPARYPVPRTRPRAVPARYRGPAVDFGRLRFANRRYRRYLLLGFALILLLLIILSRCQQGTPYYSAAEDYAPQAFDDLLLGLLFTVEVEQDISWRAVAAVYLALTPPDARGQEGDLSARLTECRALLPPEGPGEGQERDYFRAALGQPGGDAAWSQYTALDKIDRVFQGKQFPLALDANFDYADSWQQSRTFGGDRQHEGCDIMADQGTPVYAVCGGVVTKKGWLTLGGWRLGIQSEDGIYYYYAHLSAYAQGLEEGDTVQKGQLLGYVGDTGYGPEGTSGQFAPHLHFGMYADSGQTAFNAYPYLKAWQALALKNTDEK